MNLKTSALVIVLSAAVIALAFYIYSSRSCPLCDDGNPCTEDFCSRETEYSCGHVALSGAQTGCGGVSVGCVEFYCDKGVCAKATALDCCGNSFCEKNESKETCPKDCSVNCPPSCDDEDSCTRDFCGVTTNFTCVHEKVVSHTCKTSCPPSCDDKNACTEDFCSEVTEFRCFHSPITPCCGDHVCSEYEELSCFADCPMREEPLTALPAFKGTQEAEWIHPYSKDLVFQTETQNVTYQVACRKFYGNGSEGFFLTYITESRKMGRFDEQETYGGFNGYIECVEGVCNADPDYSKEPKMGTRLLNASRGAKARVYFYVVLKDGFFYEETVDGRVPKEIASVACNLTIYSGNPPQAINERFTLRFKPSCGDKIQDQGEVGVDCGGPCAPCACLTDDDCERPGWVGRLYCWSAFRTTAKNYKYVECEEPSYDKPYCNVTIVPKDLGYPCREKGYY